MSAASSLNGPISAHVPVAAVTRSGLVESVHHGSVAGIGADGALVLSVGDTTGPVYGRSSNKPLQAVALVEAGLDVPPDLLVLVAASHNGEAIHLDAVRRLLAVGGLEESALRNTAALPLHEATARRATASRLNQNCSGKHAGMLVTCMVNGWPIADYLEPDHPVQQHINRTVEALSGESLGHVGIDGCGAPVHAVSLAGLARAFRAIALAEPATPAGRVATAIRSHPYLLGGAGREITTLVRDLPGLVGKDGAEGVEVVALPDGRAAAIKIADGSARARMPVLLAALARLGVDVGPVAVLADVAVLGHGRPVGAVMALPW